MKLEEYLETLSEQIRYTKIRPSIAEELKNHILDQAESYEADGVSPEKAMEQAILDMGDPVQTGVALDRIHRPQMNWGIVGIIALISLFSIVFFHTADFLQPGFLWQRQTVYVFLGFLAMLVVYRVDYSILEKYGKIAAGTFLLMIFLGSVTAGLELNGAKRWIHLGPANISISEIILLYIPLFGAVLYSHRREGYSVFIKLIPWIAFPTFFILKLPDLSGALILFTCLLCMVMLTVWKDWYCVNKKAVLGSMAVLFALLPLILIGSVFLFGKAYHAARLEAWFSGNRGYIQAMIQSIRQNSVLWGSNKDALSLFSANAPTAEYLTDFILISIGSIYGTLAAISIVAALCFIILKIFHLSVTQKNQLGMIVGCGCGFAFLTKTLLSVLLTLGLIPYVPISMPFLSYGGSSVMVSYILLGLVLSVYRHRNILPEKRKKERKTA